MVAKQVFRVCLGLDEPELELGMAPASHAVCPVCRNQGVQGFLRSRDASPAARFFVAQGQAQE